MKFVLLICFAITSYMTLGYYFEGKKTDSKMFIIFSVICGLISIALACLFFNEI